MESQKQKHKRSRKQELKSNVTEVASGREQTVPQKNKSKRKAEAGNHDNEIVAVANAKRVQNLLTRRQHVTVSDEDNLVRTEIIEVEEEGEESGSEETSDLAQKKRFVQNLPTSPQSSDGHFSSSQHHQSFGGYSSTPLHQASGSNFHWPQH